MCLRLEFLFIMYRFWRSLLYQTDKSSLWTLTFYPLTERKLEHFCNVFVLENWSALSMEKYSKKDSISFSKVFFLGKFSPRRILKLGQQLQIVPWIAKNIKISYKYKWELCTINSPLFKINNNPFFIIYLLVYIILMFLAAKTVLPMGWQQNITLTPQC